MLCPAFSISTLVWKGPLYSSFQKNKRNPQHHGPSTGQASQTERCFPRQTKASSSLCSTVGLVSGNPRGAMGVPAHHALAQIMGTSIICSVQEGTPHPSPFLWDWLNWLLCHFKNSGVLHEKQPLYIKHKARVRPLCSDSFGTVFQWRKGHRLKRCWVFSLQQLANSTEVFTGLDFLTP